MRVQKLDSMRAKSIEGVKLLIFDLDGTLIDSKTDISGSINTMLKNYGFAPLDPDIVWKYLGDGALYLVDRCFGYYGVSAPLGSIEFFIKEYRNNYLRNTSLYPGILDALQEFKGFRKALLSNKIEDVTLKICDGLQITSFFEYIVGGGRFKKKPDPEGAKDILAHFKVLSENAAIIGDTTIDVETGKNLGLKTIAVTWGVHDRDTLLKSKPDRIVDSAEELKSLLIQ